MKSESGQGLSGVVVEMTLPASNGLGGLDLVIGVPADFGNQDEHFSTETDQTGAFRLDLGDRVYHKSVWILPPLGAFPRNPPAPFFFLKVPDLGGEYVAVETQSGRFELFSASGGKLSFEESGLLSLDVAQHSSDDGRQTTGSVALRLDR